MKKKNSKEILNIDENFDTTFKISKKYNLNYLQESVYKTMMRNDTKIIFVDGPAGTSKTYVSVLGGLEMLSKKKINEIIYIRSIIESASRSMGHLPGEIEEKFAPWSAPLLEKMDELLSPTIKNNLLKKGIVRSIPVNFTRGLTFKNSLVIIDEAQNLDVSELVTLLTRFGEDSIYMILGDSMQTDIKNSGFEKILKCFNDQECDENGMYVFEFSENEIVRSEILKFIVKKLKHLS